MTLREILDEHMLSREHVMLCSEGGCPWKPIESWAYGQERECEKCEWGKVVIGQEDHSGHRDDVYGDCPTCHGHGTIREPGLVERFEKAADLFPDGRISAALREELGVDR